MCQHYESVNVIHWSCQMTVLCNTVYSSLYNIFLVGGCHMSFALWKMLKVLRTVIQPFVLITFYSDDPALFRTKLTTHKPPSVICRLPRKFIRSLNCSLLFLSIVSSSPSRSGCPVLLPYHSSDLARTEEAWVYFLVDTF